ncbi:hypothetical protein Pmani_026009 [Petrolisthes manimaculis]|uniref:Uncharacterized protein n=1 Tax=Petrolisthes manimaculis TaxID=1843537 RepID=A0AAE1TYB0_9EUCA|nr:hypothetical protein Pmani_026009 [Petrolisthes manimaculis]
MAASQVPRCQVKPEGRPSVYFACMLVPDLAGRPDVWEKHPASRETPPHPTTPCPPASRPSCLIPSLPGLTLPYHKPCVSLPYPCFHPDPNTHGSLL